MLRRPHPAQSDASTDDAPAAVERTAGTDERPTSVLLIDPSGRGGIAAYTGMVAEALREAGAATTALVERDVVVSASAGLDVIRRLPPQTWGRSGPIGPRFVAARALGWLRWAFAVERTVRELRPDVVHFQAPFNRRFDARLVARVARRATTVWTAHDVLPFERTPADEQRFATIYRAADGVLVHSVPAASELRALSGVEATVVEHPVPARLTTADRAQAREALGLPAGEPIVAALGFVRPYKGYGLLADVWERLGDAAPLLLLMGELSVASERTTVDRIRRLPRTDVRPGYAPAERLELAAVAADAIALPYTEASDSGLVHLGRAVGTPVLASDAPQLAASVVAARAGAIVPRDVDRWSEAVLAPPPSPPAGAPARAAIGAAHLAAYARAGRRQAPATLIAYSDANVLGGAEASLAELLAGLPDRFEVTVAGVDAAVVEAIARRRPGSARVVLPPIRDKRDVGPIAAHLRAIATRRPQLLHANLRHPWSCQYAIAAGLATPGTQVVAVEHCFTLATAPMQQHLKRLFATRYAAHVAVSDALARAVEREAGLPCGSVRTIYNGVEDRDPGPAPDRGGKDAPLVGALGRLSGEKGHDVLLRAIAQLPDAQLAVGGEGDGRPALEELAENLGIADRVTFRGQVADVPAWLRTVDVLANPSRADALPLAVIEAMLAERAVAATAVGGVPEILEHEATGLLVAPEDPAALATAIGTLLGDEALRARLGAAARESALARFDPARMVSAFAELYATLLAPTASVRDATSIPQMSAARGRGPSPRQRSV